MCSFVVLSVPKLLIYSQIEIGRKIKKRNYQKKEGKVLAHCNIVSNNNPLDEFYV